MFNLWAKAALHFFEMLGAFREHQRRSAIFDGMEDIPNDHLRPWLVGHQS